MKSDEVIRFKCNGSDYQMILERALRYAVYSLPFTVNRMKLDIENRLMNIVKGKIAEMLFQKYCEVYKVPADFQSTATEYYQVDRRDFLMAGIEWDIKNNFHRIHDVTNEDILHFPALVPNRHANDQWESRKKLYFPENAPNGCGFLFTFIYQPGDRKFVELNIPESSITTLSQLCKYFRGIPLDSPPGQEYEGKVTRVLQSIQAVPTLSDVELLITGYATNQEFDLFKNTHPRSFYTPNNRLIMATRIPNMYVCVAQLPSFKSFLDRL